VGFNGGGIGVAGGLSLGNIVNVAANLTSGGGGSLPSGWPAGAGLPQGGTDNWGSGGYFAGY
jgi:hypothetical protein